jgi:low affinity Fe/Cu permease
VSEHRAAAEPTPPEVARRRRHLEELVGAEQRWQRGLIAGPSTVAEHGPSWRRRSWGSRALHRLGELTSHSSAGLGATAFVLAWLLVGVVTSFGLWWQTVLYSVTGSVTFVMVFAIQHTQSRQQSATQRKLDELIRAVVAADDRLIAVEEAPDEELEAFTSLNLEDHDRARPHPA